MSTSTPTEQRAASGQPTRSEVIKAKAVHEAQELFRIFFYLFVTLSLFTLYANLLSRARGGSYVGYGFAFIEAFIGAKVILIAQNRAFTHKHEERPLIYPTLYKSMIFLLLMFGFSVLERVVESFIHHEAIWVTLTAGVHILTLIVRNATLFLCLIPFFAFRELERVQGENVLYKLFIHPGPGPSPKSVSGDDPQFENSPSSPVW